MSESALAKKLLLKPGMGIVIESPPDGYLGSLGELPKDVRRLDKDGGTADFVQVFLKTRQEVDSIIPDLLIILKNNGLFWVCYPEGGSIVATDLNHNILWEGMKKYGLTPVALVSRDSVWSAMRFRPEEKVKRKS